MISQNGWSTIDSSNLDTSPVPGTNLVPVPGLRAGDVATVLLEVGHQFNETVAPLYNPGCWGWNTPIPIPGSSVISNHGSGTAIDFNAPSFPWQQRTMTDAQRQACRVIVNHMDGLVAWGGDFTTIVDEMHFEINGTEDEVRQLAERLKGEQAMTPDELNLLNQIAADRQIDASDPFVVNYTGKPVLQTLVDVERSASNRELRRKAREYDKIIPVLNDAVNWKNFAIAQLKAPETKGVSQATIDKLAKQADDLEQAIKKVNG